MNENKRHFAWFFKSPRKTFFLLRRSQWIQVVVIIYHLVYTLIVFYIIPYTTCYIYSNIFWYCIVHSTLLYCIVHVFIFIQKKILPLYNCTSYYVRFLILERLQEDLSVNEFIIINFIIFYLLFFSFQIIEATKSIRNIDQRNRNYWPADDRRLQRIAFEIILFRWCQARKLYDEKWKTFFYWFWIARKIYWYQNWKT
jgi:hypothetical protein